MLGGLNKKLRCAGLLLLAVTPALTAVSSANAETSYASIQRKNAAIGHYARARALMVDALAEFEQARKYARPDMLIDPEEWRLSVISRTEELNRILDPKPKVTRDGVRFQANKLLIRREKDRVPEVEDGAESTNFVGEAKARVEKRQARARMEIPEDEPVKVIPKEPVKVTTTTVKETQETTVKQTTAPDAKSAELAITFPAEPELAPGAQQNVVSAPPAEAPKAPVGKLIIDDEEIVTTKQVEKPKAPIVIEETEEETAIDEEAATARKAAGSDSTRLDVPKNDGPIGEEMSLEQKEDEVTKEIERAIQERISREKSEGADASLGEDDE